MKRIIEWLIYIYVIMLIFGGVITKIVVKSLVLMNIKTILPDLVMVLIIICSCFEILNPKKETRKSLKVLLLITTYIIFIFVFNLVNLPTLSKLLLIFRDTCLPFVTLFLLIKIKFTNEEIMRIKKVLIFIFSVQIIFGVILGSLQRILDWEWSSKFYTGYSFYGLDPISGIKIWHSSGVLRVPSLSGNSVLFAFYNYVCYVVIKYSRVRFKKTLLILSVVNIYLSTTKTVLGLVLLELLIYYIIKFKPKLKLLMIEFSLIIVVGIALTLPLVNENIYFSMNERLIHWGNLISSYDLIDYIIPLNLFNIGAGTSGALGFVDNAFFYFLLSYGIIGLIIYSIFIIINLIESIKNQRYIIVSFLIGLCISSMSINIFQGRAYVSIIFVLYFVYYRKDYEVIE